MEYIPWSDPAIAACIRKDGHPGERIMVGKGTLADVIDAISQAGIESDETLIISLPERIAAPFGYSSTEIGQLIATRLRAR